MYNKEEVKDIIEQGRLASRFRFIIAGGGILYFLIVDVIVLKLKIDILLKLTLAFSIYLIIVAILNIAIKKQKSIEKIYGVNFLHAIFDVIFITFIMHYCGGIGWIVSFAYVGALTYYYVVLPRREAFFVTCIATLLFVMLTALEYFGIISHHSIFPALDLSKDPRYLLVSIFTFFGVILSINGVLIYFAGIIKKKNNLLSEHTKETQDIRDSLEIRVKARKEELGELTKRLNREVQEKEKDLQEKIKELQETNNQTVKRELRMMELKKEINQLKDALDKY